MNKKFYLQLGLVLMMFIMSCQFSHAQNRSFGVGFDFGIGSGSFDFFESSEEQGSPLIYPTAGIHFLKRLDPNWALDFYSSVSMAGRSLSLNDRGTAIRGVETRSAYLNQALHARYYWKDRYYFSIGPELAFLIWNRGKTFDVDGNQLSSNDESNLFIKTNFMMSGSIGYSTKVQSSRKNAPIQIDALWFIELRTRQGISNILNESPGFENISSRLITYEIATGFVFSTQN